MIVIVFGLPGSGKSFFASRLAKMINADYINSDKIRKEMFASRTYSEQEKAAIYNAMLEKTKVLANQKKNLVLDATFHKNETRYSFQHEMEGIDNIYFIEVWAAEDITRERLKEHRLYSEADYEVYQSIRQHWEALKEPHLSLESTNENIAIMLQKAAAYCTG